MAGSLNNVLFDDGKKTTPLDGVEEQLFLRTRDSGKDRLVRYSALLVLSAVIATGGVLVDSTATVIGAMIVAPLATPILAVGLAITTVRPHQVGFSALIIVASSATVVFLGFFLATVLPAPINIEQNSQIVGRVSPNLIDLLIAVATGLVGAFAITRSDLAGVLPGVAIAISLVPPLAVVGVLASVGAWSLASGALLLFASNAIAMIGAGALVFTIAGYNGAARRARREVRRPILIVALMSALIVIPLGVASAQSVTQAIEISRLEKSADVWLADSDFSLLSVNPSHEGFLITVIGNGELPDSAVFYEAYEPVFWFEPVVTIRRFEGNVQPLTAPSKS
jgi:uncharacterized hydrophobic protein (TIGR00271 family)